MIEPLPNLLLLAVWDGHGGSECSNFCSENIEKFLLRRLSKNEQHQTEEYNLEEVLHKTLLDLNTAFSKHWKPIKGQKSSPGSTATLALIRGGYELVIAHIGDSLAMLCRNKEPRRLKILIER